MRTRCVAHPGAPLAGSKPRVESEAFRERRDRQRFDTSQHVELCVSKLVMAAELVNISDHGAKLRIARGLVPSIGRRVMIRLFDRTVTAGAICWVGRQDIGVAFFSDPINAEDYLHYDDLGQRYYAMILQQQRRLHAL